VSEGASDNSIGSTGDQSGDPKGDEKAERTGNRALVSVLLYSAARLLLAVVLTAVIYGVARVMGVTQFPVVVAALFALIIAMPLGIWLFGPLRRRATAELAIAGERRRRERDQLQARLHGDPVPGEEDDDA
jgi:Protein of unknown function (DUF4229)